MKKPIILNENGHLSMPEFLHSHIFTLAYKYMQPNGWFDDHPCDEEGITPWMTYPAIQFLKDVVSKENKVFEYGSGFSTIFFNNNAGEVVSVEHDPLWYNNIISKLPQAHIHLVEANTQVHPEAQLLVNEFKDSFPQIRTDLYDHDLKHGLINNEFAGYASTLYNYPKGHFDIIVLDGMARTLSGILAVERIADNGLIILDNSDRWHYNMLQQYLNNKGFSRIDFWGPGFNSHSAWCTSIFARNMPFKNQKLNRPVTEGPITV